MIIGAVFLGVVMGLFFGLKKIKRPRKDLYAPSEYLKQLRKASKKR